MDWQLIITILIIVYALGYTIYALVQLFKRKRNCGGGCSGCNFKNELRKRQKIKNEQLHQLKYIPKE